MFYDSCEQLCILLSHVFVASNKKCKSILEKYNDIDALKSAIFNDSTFLQGFLGEQDFSTLVSAVKDDEISKILARLENEGVICVTLASRAFPTLLKNIYDPPICLFCLGDIRLLKTDCLAVVGTRKINNYGKSVATNFTMALARYFTIVSGLAIGIDSVAHETALFENGKTIAVLGSGLNVIYPACNTNLFNKILNKGGLVVSEYPLDMKPLQHHFPQRNRIVSGLSRGLLICQAPKASGTMSTARFAVDEGRDLFVIPGEIYDFSFLGSNELVKSLQGAMVTSPDDIIKFYNHTPVQESIKIELDEDEQKIVNLLKIGKMHFDELLFQSKLKPSELNIALSQLELKGVILKSTGNNFQLVGGNR